MSRGLGWAAILSEVADALAPGHRTALVAEIDEGRHRSRGRADAGAWRSIFRSDLSDVADADRERQRQPALKETEVAIFTSMLSHVGRWSLVVGRWSLGRVRRARRLSKDEELIRLCQIVVFRPDTPCSAPRRRR
jgi:hypothetical protein